MYEIRIEDIDDRARVLFESYIYLVVSHSHALKIASFLSSKDKTRNRRYWVSESDGQFLNELTEPKTLHYG